MICLTNIRALFIKQFKDVLKNMPVLILYIIYPCIALIITNSMQGKAGQSDLFLSMFATMHCVFTPIIATASFISEEKENNMLRALIMSSVTLREYFLSVGGFVLLTDLLTGSAFLFITDNDFQGALLFLLSMSIGCVISILVGLCIGLYARNAAAANGLAVPLGLVFSFLPVLSSFNSNITKVSKFTFGQQISYLITGEKSSSFKITVIAVNFVLSAILAAILYKRSLSEE